MTRRKTAGTPQVVVPAVVAGTAVPDTLLNDLRQLIEQARQSAAVAVNASLTLMYWRIGRRIGTEVLGGQRAEYGEQIVSTLSRQLSAQFGRSFERTDGLAGLGAGTMSVCHPPHAVTKDVA